MTVQDLYMVVDDFRVVIEDSSYILYIGLRIRMNNKTPYNTHELKILPKWFEDVQANKKNFEIRKNDRNFEVGDYLILKEWYRGKFTDRYVIRQIEYIYKGDGTYGLSEDYCVLGLKLPPVTHTMKDVPEEHMDKIIERISFIQLLSGKIVLDIIVN